MGIDPVPKYKSQARDYMATLWDSLRQFFQDFRQFVAMTSRKFGLTIEDRPTEADVDVLPHGLETFNESRWPAHQPWAPMGVFVRDQEKVVAGLAGETYGGWLFVRYLWVSEALRGHGIGQQLLAAGEARALERGCHSVWLDTFSFQAPGFYQKLGYQVFAELAWSATHKRIFLRKSLRKSPS